MNTAPSIIDTLMSVINQSVQVLSKPRIETFERYKDKGTLRESIIYVLIASLITGLLGLGGASGFWSGMLSTIAGFLVFIYLVHYVGKVQGGTGTLDSVAYTFALFWVPINVLFALTSLILLITPIGIFLLPLLVAAALLINIYLAYLAVQSSMNLHESGKIWVTLGIALLGTLAVSIAVALLLN